MQRDKYWEEWIVGRQKSAYSAEHSGGGGGGEGVLEEALFACLAAATAITWSFVRPPAPLNLLQLQSTLYSTLLYFANNSHCFLKLQPGDLFNANGV